MQQMVFLNFFGVSIFIATVFYLLVSLFIFIGIANKSRSTVMLGLAFLFSGLLALPYLFAYSVGHPLMAFHRWGTVPAALLIHPFFAQTILHFPKTNFPRAARALLIFQLICALALTAIFYAGTVSAERVYSFNGHFYDFEAEALSQLVGLTIVLNLLSVIVAGVAQTIRSPGSRFVTGSFTLVFALAFSVPAATNVLSRDGLMSRDLHQTFLVLMSILGLFSVLIIYLNNTKDETTFLVKIMGVSLVTFMALMVFICFFSFEEQESSYDALHAERTARLVIDGDYDTPDLEYLVAYNLEEDRFQYLRGSEAAATVDFSDIKDEFIYTATYQSIQNLGGDDWREDLNRILEATPDHFAGYRAMLLELAPQVSTPAELLTLSAASKQRIAYRANKISAIPNAGFRPALDAYLEKFSEDMVPFRTAIRAELARRPDLEGEALKSTILRYFIPFHSPGTRLYRRGEQERFFTAFMFRSRTDTRVYEAGFSYAAYRQYIHPVGLKLTLIFLSIVLVVVVGFRFFFLGTLVRPLDRLLDGVRRVNEGELSVEIPVATADEIGFLTRSFNGMVISIRSAQKKLEQYADELEDKVKERTAELQDTLSKVQQLKVQQDGDYFLTSLLIKPLTGNWSRSETVDVDYLLRQKKRFSFRKWKEEIGGDFCAAHSILLRDRPHTVFVNADAMGKSIQGAGGALVLGAVFESLMERTKTMSTLKQQSPERWIKNAFQELQRVFESFDGSMLVSIALGVIDDRSGLLYYINAEHPWGVLYRDGKARFFEEKPMFRKLGISGLVGQISVLTLQLEPNDVIIVGSDGRDDLLIGTGKSGERIINEDETLFLGVVQDAGGDLSSICSHLGEIGELTDDLSLMKVTYHAPGELRQEPSRIAQSEEKRVQAARHLRAGESVEAERLLQEALALDPHNPAAMRLAARAHLEKKDYASALEAVEDYIHLRPADTEMMYLAAYLYKKLRRFSDAVDYGERVRLREPNYVRNLVTLGEVYLALGNRERAAKMLDQALKHDPEHARARKLAERARGPRAVPD